MFPQANISWNLWNSWGVFFHRTSKNHRPTPKSVWETVFRRSWSCWRFGDSFRFALHPGRLTWNLKSTYLERNMIFQTSMIMFHVNLPGCKTHAPSFSKAFISRSCLATSSCPSARCLANPWQYSRLQSHFQITRVDFTNKKPMDFNNLSAHRNETCEQKKNLQPETISGCGDFLKALQSFLDFHPPRVVHWTKMPPSKPIGTSW